MAVYHPHHLLAPSSYPANSYPISLVFDPYADLLWSGSSTGLVQSFSSPASFTRNVCFPAHGSKPLGITQAGLAINSPAVREIWVGDREIISLTERGLGGRKRGGAAKWALDEGATALSSMCISPTNSSEIIAGGTQPAALIVNTHTGSLIRTVDCPNLRFVRRAARLVATGSTDGLVRFHDPRSMKVEQSISAHLGGLTGLEAVGWNVMTLGYTVKQGHPLPDPMVKVFDVRTFKPLPAISFETGPAFVLPDLKKQDSMIVVSVQGSFMAVEIGKPWEARFHQLDVSTYVTSAAISSSGSFLAFGDAGGNHHIWSSIQDPLSSEIDSVTFNGFEGIQTEWPDAVTEASIPTLTVDAPPPPSVSVAPVMGMPTSNNEEDPSRLEPLNLIGMPHYTTPLLSNIPASTYCPPTSPFFNPPAKIPASVLGTMRMVDFVGYAQTPRELKGTRNRVGPRKKKAGEGGPGGPRFRSEQTREPREGDRVGTEGEGEAGRGAEGEGSKYRKVEIQYSKFGVEDFDFGYYNQTQYSGLETHIASSYTNSLLQALHYTLPFRLIAKSHISTACTREHCLLCECGFLFRMLEDAAGTNCQATNFSRAVGGIPQIHALGLFDSEDESGPPKAYGTLLQNFTRFALEHMSAEAKTYNLNPNSSQSQSQTNPWLFPMLPIPRSIPSTVAQVTGLELKQTNTCLACGTRTARTGIHHMIDLTYRRKALPNELPTNKDFSSVLHDSITRDTTTKAVCIHCKQFAPLRNRRSLSSPSAIESSTTMLPPVLCLNAALHSADIMEDFWMDRPNRPRPFLPTAFGFVQDGEDFKILGPEWRGSWKKAEAMYELRALIVETHAGTDERHLVSIVKIPAEELDSEAASPWYIFNDFLVSNISEEEALSFAGSWKTPAVIIYERTDSRQPLDLSILPMGIEPSILSRDVSVSWNRNPARMKHRYLTPDELPEAGTLVAIDAEFVAMQFDDLELRSDGTKKVLRPSKLSLARVSCLRGSGSQEEVPFIDDHIHTSEPVVDYLTDFSGIHPGDLDPPLSEHTLVPLKVAYKKLRLLVDLGCIFIGHGLKKDFRIINIFVPPSQVLDTVDLYSSPQRQRKVSLRFLTWFLLKNDIQTGEHDSIEDARAALQLYRLYLGFQKEGRFDDVMDDIFAEGKRLNWKPPGAAPPPPDRWPPVAMSTTQPSTPEPRLALPAHASSAQTQMTSTMRRLPNGPPFPPRPPPPSTSSSGSVPMPHLSPIAYSNPSPHPLSPPGQVGSSYLLPHSHLGPHQQQAFPVWPSIGGSGQGQHGGNNGTGHYLGPSSQPPSQQTQSHWRSYGGGADNGMPWS
ncbi:pab-dependent poly-specific ribonuclease subunit pan2 [Phaffia rhodozyma]|uniref:PAN2-PAN3 deadenylation complex catalytic subunit PAN2 n=1 Tax=Phaffia rhodozyma TaxID=264483 RepID=A0A0F7SK79_PHARH|nr:pab-dependent poly-specific ribonuclease subunit pan2 [Phaffia rhodozyma]